MEDLFCQEKKISQIQYHAVFSLKFEKGSFSSAKKKIGGNPEREQPVEYPTGNPLKQPLKSLMVKWSKIPGLCRVAKHLLKGCINYCQRFIS